MTGDGSAEPQASAVPSPRLGGLLRLLGLGPASAPLDGATLRRLVDERMERVIAGLVEEAAASDDVLDAASARAYLDARLRDLQPYLTAGQIRRIRAAAFGRIEQW